MKEASYKRFRIELFNAVEKLLEDFEMTWDDLAEKLDWGVKGVEMKGWIGVDYLDLRELNENAHRFSAGPYMIFRPRKPWIQT